MVKKLRNINQLLKESFEIYRVKIKTLLGIVGLPVGFSFLFWLLTNFLSGTSIKYSIWFSIISAISSLGSLFLWLLAIPSLLYSLKENTSIEESYKRGLKILSSFIWVYFLLNIIITGGLALFIIPGIIFSIWFSLAVFIVVFEGRKGFDALFKSKQLVKGEFWGVLIRFLILGLIILLVLFLVFTLIYFGIENKQIEVYLNKVISYFVRLFVLPFFLIYGFLIYSNLKEVKADILYEEPYLRNKIKYLIPGVLGTLILGFLFSISLFNIFFGRDIPPIDDSDLWLSKIEIPKEENAFYYFEKVGQKLYLPEEKADLFEEIVEGEKWDSEFAEELIKNNEEAFAYFEKALELPYFQGPELQEPKNFGLETIVHSIVKLRNLARLNSLKANYLLRQSKEKEALDLIVKTIKMGQMIEDSPHPLSIDYLVGMTIKNIGLQSLRAMIPHLTLSPEILKNYVIELEQFKANEEGLIRAMKMEYIGITNTKSKIDAAFVGGLSKEELEKLGLKKTSFEINAASKLNYLYKPNQTQRMFTEYYRNFINNANKDCSEIRLPEVQRLTPDSKIKMLFTENVVGKILHDIIAGGYSNFLVRKCLEDFSVIGTQTLMAIKAYQTKTGRIPISLTELVPEYLPEIPKDPFGGTIKYSPEKKIIYSLGKDLKDSGGSEGKNWETMEDPTFKIEF